MKQPKDDAVLIQQLKKILLDEDRQELAKIREEIKNPEKMSKIVVPIVQQQMGFLKENFTKDYKVVVNHLIEDKLKDSQEELLNILYPVLGRMVKKYVALQFQLLREGIDGKKSKEGGKKGLFSFFSRKKKNGDEVLSSINKPIIEEVYLIQKGSGLLVGQASKNPMVNSDVIAGMLTAIKAFVEDAFQKEAQELEMIVYERYKIYIQSFHSYYMAIAISGTLSAKDQDRFSSLMLQFAEKELNQNINNVTGELQEKYKEKIKAYFSFN